MVVQDAAEVPPVFARALSGRFIELDDLPLDRQTLRFKPPNFCQIGAFFDQRAGGLDGRLSESPTFFRPRLFEFSIARAI